MSYQGGNRNSHELSGGGSWVRGGWGLSGNARGFATAGYYLVQPPFRGVVDTQAGVDFAAAAFRADRSGARDRFFTRFDLLAEERDNGTRRQRNSTSLGALAAVWQRATWLGLFSFTGFHSREELRAAFSSINAARSAETLTMRQSVPAEGAGGAAYWRAGQARWTALAGFDAVRASGESRETIQPAGFRAEGGVQNQRGVFGQGDWSVGGFRFHGGLRRQWTGAGGGFTAPSGGVAWTRGRARLRAAAYRGFRAPTLNELFREFSAGNAVTLANPALRPETLAAAESGADLTFGRLRLAFTAFHNALDGLITNVTLASTPQLITRQRRNAGAATVRGAEAEARFRAGAWSAEASWLLADSRFAAGERLPQVARQQGALQLAWSRGGTVVAGGVRAASLQFEDDRNLFPLAGYAVWPLSARQRLRGRLAATLAVENAFDRRFLAAWSPTPLTGAPRLWRAGLRWN
jgi:outer membrane receptor protein involved in Fe transport